MTLTSSFDLAVVLALAEESLGALFRERPGCNHQQVKRPCEGA